MCERIWICAYECWCSWRPENSHHPPDVILGTELGTYTRVVCALRNSVISPALLFYLNIVFPLEKKNTHRYMITHITDTYPKACVLHKA